MSRSAAARCTSYKQAATILILLLAANTAFNDSPRLLYYLARDDYAPWQFRRLAYRLTFSNGIVALALAACAILLAFHGHTGRSFRCMPLASSWPSRCRKPAWCCIGGGGVARDGAGAWRSTRSVLSRPGWSG